jgi:flagellar basal-body rod protein FlgF
MANGIYVAMSGAVARQDKLDAVAENLANAQTTGFKAERGSFQSFLPEGETEGPASPAAVATGLDLTEGPMLPTGQPLDITPEQGAFLPVQLENQQVGYTRSGHVSIGEGDVLFAAGHPLLDNTGSPIPVPPGQKAEIGSDGVVTIQGTTVAQISAFKLSGPLTRTTPTVTTLGQGAAATPGNGRLRIGVLEGANYDATEGLVDMITAEREYDASMQAIQTYRSMSDTSNKLGTVQ